MLTTNQISRTFIRFAEHECKGSSALYEFLAKKIAQDEELLEICTHCREGQPIPNLFFAAVHFLLLKGKNHPLRYYYPNIVNKPKIYNESYELFKDFCFTYQEEIVEILQTKRVQTNEVRRSAYLYPVFCVIYEISKKPLALIEIGTSAGLQLLWDHYSYSYGNDRKYGNINSTVHITTTIKGNNLPFLLKASPPVSTRIGIDLHPVDLANEEDKLWLKALIWPEHSDRMSMFESAYVNESSVNLVEGDGIQLLPKYIEKVPRDEIICVFHTHVANQMSLEMKKQLLETIEKLRKKREVFHVYNNIYDQYLHLDYYINSEGHHHIIAETDGHGSWFIWMENNRIKY